MACFCCSVGYSNGLTIKNLHVNSSGKLAFSIGWHNAWRADNHDAVWVFAKGQTESLLFEHLDIATASGNLAVAVPDDAKGIMVYTFQTGAFDSISGDFEVEFKNFQSDKYLQIKLFAVEMVYVPRGEFVLGDTACQFSLLGAQTKQPVRVTGESKMDLTIKNQDLTVNLPETYPKGYAGFYMMKYEISQAQYAEFLNTLTKAQQIERTASASPGLAMVINGMDSFRNTITMTSQGRYETPTPHRACNFLSWQDLTAYLDWAALRPATELEFEKAARGTDSLIEKGFPWGTALFVNANTVVFDGFENETVTEQASLGGGLANSGGLWGADFLQGPLRCGFGQGDDRFSAGASVWGIRELAGNVWEMCVSVRVTDFKARHGDGNLSTPTAWPETGGYRGGAWNSLIKNDLSYTFRDLAISDRYYMDLGGKERRNTSGGRGVRTIN